MIVILHAACVLEVTHSRKSKQSKAFLKVTMG